MTEHTGLGTAHPVQYSLFGAEVSEPELSDLDGVLVAGGQWVRAGGSARLSVVVLDRWREDALATTFEQLGLGPEVVAAEVVAAAQFGLGVRTGFSPSLAPVARRWTKGANLAPPPGLKLTVGGLRLWAITAGQLDCTGYLLGTDSQDDALHRVAGGQLAALGLAAASVASRGGPGWRVTSAKRLRRLAEIVGAPPPGAAQNWPI